jgi:hypothetical protein
MSRYALLLFVLVGCSAGAEDGTGSTEGAATVAPAAAADAHAPATLDGKYNAHMTNQWDGYLEITKASPETFDFGFAIAADDVDLAPIGRLDGTAKRESAGHYRFVDGDCTIDFQELTGQPGTQPGDLAINATIACAVDLAIEDHYTSSTALDFTETWHRY